MVACKRKSDEREYSSMKNLRDACTRTKSVCTRIRGRTRLNVMRLC